MEKSGIKCFSGSTMDRGKEKRDRNVSVMKNIDRIRYLDNSNFDWYLSIGKGISMMDRGEDRGVLKERIWNMWKAMLNINRFYF